MDDSDIELVLRSDRPIGTALVTGVSGYIGAAVAGELQDRGYHVLGIDRDEPTRVEFTGQFMAAELGVLSDWKSLTLPVSKIDHVIHVAGGASSVEVQMNESELMSDLDDIEYVFQQNYLSAIEIIKVARPLMSNGGSITLTSSINALGSYGLPIYSSAKAALHGLVVSFAPVLAKERIRLNIAAPGTVDHPGVRHLHRHQPGHFEALRATTDDNMLLTPQGLAKHVVDLAHDTGTWGQVKVFDNGQLNHQKQNGQ